MFQYGALNTKCTESRQKMSVISSSYSQCCCKASVHQILQALHNSNYSMCITSTYFRPLTIIIPVEPFNLLKQELFYL